MKEMRVVDENEIRDEIIQELRRNLAECRSMLMNDKLDAKTRERWTQLYTSTASSLNAVLRDRQIRDLTKRLQELESHGRVLKQLHLRVLPGGRVVEVREGGRLLGYRLRR